MPLLALLFVLSGAAGLIYESVWARYISLLVGHSAYAQVIVLVIFLGGMAVGALLVGNWTERIRSPLLWYAIAEAIIGSFAFAFHGVFVATTNMAYEHWLPSLSPGVELTAVTWSIAALLILPQSILLGATFPLMTAGAIRRWPGRSGASLGLLYFANSFGAAVGALVEGFVLIGSVGLNGTLHAAAWLNVIVAVGVAGAFVRPRQSPDVVETGAPIPVPDPFASDRPLGDRLRQLRTMLLAVSFATAFSSFFYEIAWTRMLSLVHGSATHSFELMLSAFVLGLACGALWIGQRADRVTEPIALLARLQWAMGLAAIATLPLYVMSFDWTATLLSALKGTDAAYSLYSVVRYAMTLVIMLPATFFAGTTLPLITRTLLASGSGERAIGAVYGVNTVGSIVGAGVAALVLIPLIGLKWVLISGGLIDIAVGIGLWIWHDRSHGVAARTHLRLWAAAAATGAVIVGVVILSPFSPTRLGSGVYRYAAVTPEGVLRYYFYKDGRTASVSVRQDVDDSLSLMTISTNGKPDASVMPLWMRPYDPSGPKLLLDQDMSTQVFLPLLTLSHAPRARIGAVIGQGSGITSHMLLGSPTLQRLHTIEIEPEMIRGSRLFYPGNRRVFDDPRSIFENDDARAFLATSGPRFDFVLSEPSNPWVSGVSSLFTVEFYKRVRSRLNQGGVFVQWFHLYEIDDATVATVLASIDRVFPSYRVYLCSNSDIIIVGGVSADLARPDWSVTASPGVSEDLRRFPPLVQETFDASEIGGRETLHGYLMRSLINSDFAPLLDLNGERLRFRQDFATGFRDLGEMRLDIGAAIENRRRGFGRLMTNPVPEIARPAALTRATLLRVAHDSGASMDSTADDSLRQDGHRLQMFDRELNAKVAPVDWAAWMTEFASAEAIVHGGTAGVADERFYGAVNSYLNSVSAPPAPRAAVDFYHGLAAWNFAQAARAGDRVYAEQRTGPGLVPAELLRLGTALAKVRLGDLVGASGVYDRLPAGDRQATVADRVLSGLIDDRVSQQTRRP